MKPAEIKEVCDVMEHVLLYFGDDWEHHLAAVVANMAMLLARKTSSPHIMVTECMDELRARMTKGPTKTWSDDIGKEIKKAPKKRAAKKKADPALKLGNFDVADSDELNGNQEKE